LFFICSVCQDHTRSLPVRRPRRREAQTRVRLRKYLDLETLVCTRGRLTVRLAFHHKGHLTVRWHRTYRQMSDAQKKDSNWAASVARMSGRSGREIRERLSLISLRSCGLQLAALGGSGGGADMGATLRGQARAAFIRVARSLRLNPVSQPERVLVLKKRPLARNTN
jgi:hypothetical protein